MSVRSFRLKFTRSTHVIITQNSFLILDIYLFEYLDQTMSFRPAQKPIPYGRTRSSQRRAQNSQTPSPSKDIDDSTRPSKKAKTRNLSRQFDIYEDIDIELNDQNTRESSIISNSPKQRRIPRITVEIPRR